MKPLSTYLTEAKAWYVPFVELFQKNIDQLIQTLDPKEVFNNPTIKKYGSPGSKMFTISYTNEHGKQCSFDFTFSTYHWGRGKKTFTRPEYIQDVADDLIDKNLNKLPKLKFDMFGNVDD